MTPRLFMLDSKGIVVPDNEARGRDSRKVQSSTSNQGFSLVRAELQFVFSHPVYVRISVTDGEELTYPLISFVMAR